MDEHESARQKDHSTLLAHIEAMQVKIDALEKLNEDLMARMLKCDQSIAIRTPTLGSSESVPATASHDVLIEQRTVAKIGGFS